MVGIFRYIPCNVSKDIGLLEAPGSVFGLTVESFFQCALEKKTFKPIKSIPTDMGRGNGSLEMSHFDCYLQRAALLPRTDR